MAKPEFAPFGKCPICKKPLWPEMLAMGYNKPDEKGKQKMKFNLFASFSQIIDYAIDQALRAAATAASEGTASGVTENRDTRYCCNNDNCPISYSMGQKTMAKYYFRQIPGTQLVELVGEPTGLVIEGLRNAYKPPKEKPQGGGGGGQQQEEPEEEEEPQEEEGAPEEEQDEGGEEEEE